MPKKAKRPTPQRAWTGEVAVEPLKPARGPRGQHAKGVVAGPSTVQTAQGGPCGAGTDGLRPAQLSKAAPRIVRGRSSPGKGAQDPSSGAAREASWAFSLARRAAATPAGGFAAEG